MYQVDELVGVHYVWRIVFQYSLILLQNHIEHRFGRDFLLTSNILLESKRYIEKLRLYDIMKLIMM